MRLLTPPCRRSDRGFTLIEVMITVAIVGILAAIALPSYQKYVIRGKLPVAYGVLSGWGTAMAQYYQDNRNYSGACTAGTTAPIPADTGGFTFSCAKAAQTFTVTATGTTGTPVNQFIFTLDQAGNKATTGVPTGWTLNATCWIRDPSGSC